VMAGYTAFELKLSSNADRVENPNGDEEDWAN